MPPWSAIDTIMFDMDGTLLDLHFDNYFWLTLVPKIYSETHGVDQDTARRIIKCKYEEVHGTLDWYCVDYWEKELKLNITALKKTLKYKINVRPNVEKFLQELRLTNKRILLITNAHPASLDIKMRHTGIGEYFHQLISAHRLNLAKENHGFWERLQQFENYDPQRTLLFDDSLSVLRQAKREGIKHLYAIKQPDSQRPCLDPAEFPQVEDFDQLLPLPADSK